MKLRDLFDVVPGTEYVKIFSHSHIIQFKGLAAEYIGSLDRPVFALFATVTWSGCVCIEIILDYEDG